MIPAFPKRIAVITSKKALLGKPRLQLLKSEIKVSHPGRDQLCAVQLINAVPLIDRNAADRCHTHSVFRAKTDPGGAGSEHHALQAALCILQREIMMAGGIDLIIGKLSAHSEAPQQQVAVEESLDVCVQL